MRDVASEAGVGVKTVSRVVNGEPDVAESTRHRVRAAIARLDYRPDDSARGLRNGQIASIGLVLDDATDPFSAQLVAAIQAEAQLHGMLALSGSCNEDPDSERELSLALCARRVRGLVVVPAPGARHDYLSPYLAEGLPVVFVDRPPVALAADTVLTDSRGGAITAVRHLLAHGHRRIAFLGDDVRIHTAAERLSGYRAALHEAGLPIDTDLIAARPVRDETVSATLAAFMALPEPPTALFTANNRTTVAALRALAGFDTVPALVGFDDFQLAELMSPPVTVVAQDPGSLGETAARLLFQRLFGDRSPAQRVELATRLIPRGSGEIPPHPTGGRTIAVPPF
ncbi:LacI family DNA-binding transcriptional regulator [Salinactinospora qingdaonensis]|uniref:LacI family DNA-binding transcriptional regulator n=2 Tax=Salinactinospora qingdaonensis TaxID=702744 RepID=A0ABP7FB52_9ACTN